MTLLNRLESFSTIYFFLIGVVLATMIHMTKQETQEQVKQKIQETKGQISTQEQEVKKAKSLEQEKPKHISDINAKREIIKAAQETMPQLQTNRDVLEKVTAEAKVAGVRIVQLHPKDIQPVATSIAPSGAAGAMSAKDKEKSLYDEILYDVELEGSYTRLTYLFYLLTKIKNNVTFKNISVVKKDFAEGEATVSYKATLIAYAYKDTSKNTLAPGAAPQGVAR